jgi:hypothetical protein
MSLLRSKSTRVFFSDNGTLSDLSEHTRTWGTPNAVIPWVAVEDALYLGLPHKYSFLYFAMSVANTLTSTLSVSYWDKSEAWVLFTDLLDETDGFKLSGFMTWEEKRDWIPKKPADVMGLSSLTSQEQLYWVKIVASSNLDITTSIRTIMRLFSDDRLMTTIHPEIMNYLPSAQTDFLPQHELAKTELVTYLVRSALIKHEFQIKNPEDWILPATYKCIDLVLTAIPGDERIDKVKEDMRTRYVESMKLAAASLDDNENEVLDVNEIDPGFGGSIRMERR